MNISGILVVVPPVHTQATIDRLQALPGIEVHHTDADSGRIVITQEAETIAAEIDGLKRIRALPEIILAEMSYHYFGDDAESVDAIPTELEEEGLDTGRVPPYLNE
jgi:nitrate reductase NapD